jgi:hypothetical protein
MAERELNSCGIKEGTMAGCCEHCNVPLASIKGTEFLDKPRNCQLVKKASNQ